MYVQFVYDGCGDLRSNEIHLWYANLSDAATAPNIREGLSLLSDDELRRMSGFHFERSQRDYFFTRVFLRRTLSRYVGISPKDWCFARSPHGRPTVAWPKDIAWLEFNLSHTDGMLVLAIGMNMELGVDVERSDRAGLDVKFATTFLSGQELDDLSNIPQFLLRAKILEYWTLKEAYAKALGLGLLLPFKSFSFDIGAKIIQLVIGAPHDMRYREWSFHMINPGLPFVGALAVRPKYAAESDIAIRTFAVT